MNKVTIYTTMLCPFCVMAKRLLKQKGIEFEEINIGRSSAKRDEMQERAGGRHTVPQIFIGDAHVGGCDDLYALEQKGQLDPLLATG